METEWRRVIDITTTATLRPEILARTLESFFKNMLGGSAMHHFAYRHIMNIDCVGEECLPYDVIEVSEKYFGKMPVVRVAEDPNFTRALRWVWEQTRADYVLNLEDDWELLAPVNLLDMVSFLDEHTDFALLRFNKFEAQFRPKRGAFTARQWNRHMPWNEALQIYEVPQEYKLKLGFCGNPSLLRGSFARECASYLRVDAWDPEYQLHGFYDDANMSMEEWRYGIWQPQKSCSTIRDIGRVWLEAHRWHKHRGLGFTHWEKIDDGAIATGPETTTDV